MDNKEKKKKKKKKNTFIKIWVVPMVKYVEVHFKKLYLLQNIYLFLEWLKSKKCFFLLILKIISSVSILIIYYLEYYY